jgi:short-chain Z-isoprenyl diphosphate synthase
VTGVLPRHVGLVMDGNRRWARMAGLDARAGHRAGAEHVEDVLRWCEERGIDHLSIYVLSADNIRRRAGDEIDHLMHLLETVVPEKVLGRGGRWRLHVAGDMDLLPETTARALAAAVDATRDGDAHLTLAVGYDGRAQVAAAVRSILAAAAGTDATLGDVAALVDAESIGAALGGGPVKEIDLVIRTSGEVRVSGFFPWQSAHAELYVSPRMWPAFTAADFDAALAHFAQVRGRPRA